MRTKCFCGWPGDDPCESEAEEGTSLCEFCHDNCKDKNKDLK